MNHFGDMLHNELISTMNGFLPELKSVSEVAYDGMYQTLQCGQGSSCSRDLFLSEVTSISIWLIALIINSVLYVPKRMDRMGDS